MENRDSDIFKRGAVMEMAVVALGALGASAIAGPYAEQKKHLIQFATIGTMLTFSAILSMQQTRYDLLRALQQPHLPPPVPPQPQPQPTASESVPFAGWY
jgi:hypothetical protein